MARHGRERILKEGERWQMRTINLSKEEDNKVNNFRGKKTRSEFFRYLLAMYEKALNTSLAREETKAS